MTEAVSFAARCGSLHDPSERASLKCNQCRKDRKRCLTDGTINSPSYKKCDRCVRLHHKCGPRSKAKMLDRQDSTVLRDLTTHETIIDMPAFTLDSSGGMFCLHAFQRILLRCKCENAALLARIPHDTAFLRCATFIEEIVAGLYSEYCKLSTQQHSLSDSTTNGDIPSWLPMLSFDMHHLRYQHMRFVSGKLKMRDESVDLPFWSGLQDLYTSSLKHDHLTCTQGVLNCIDLSTLELKYSGTKANEIDVEIYRKVQIEMQTGLDTMFTQNTSVDDGSSSARPTLSKQPLFLPAAVLAYCNCDQEAAFKLMTEEGVLDLPCNAFNQNIIHLAVLSRDLGFLKRLKDFDIHGFTKASIHGDGNTPIDYAAILNDVDIFNLLLGRCYNMLPQTSHLLHLAVTAKSFGIVDAILDSGRIVLPPYTAATELAMELGAEDIAIKFIPWLQFPWTTAVDEKRVLDMARMKGMTILTERLLNSVPSIDMAQTALDSIQEHLDFLAGDDLTDTYFLSQEGNGMLFTSTGYFEDT